MKKIAKMSLVAAVAVTSLSTANAKDLTEAIKDVDVSGTVVYRYNDYKDNAFDANGTTDDSSATNNYQIAVNVSSKVNDDVKVNTRFRMGDVELRTSNQGDENVQVELSEVNFQYTGVEGLSLTVGKQSVPTPWTVSRDSLGLDQTGTGALATYTMGPVTAVGAYFNQTNFNEEGIGTGAEDIYVIGALASFAGINLDAFYADLDDTFDSYTVGLNASYNLGAVALSPFARYTALTLDNAASDADDQELWQLGLSANMGIFSAFAAYGESGDEGGLVAIDGSAQTGMDYHWRVAADNASADAEYLFLNATADVTEKINVGLFYTEADFDTAKDNEEVYVQVKYQMSKNFYTYVRYGDYDNGTSNDGDIGRLHVQYSF